MSETTKTFQAFQAFQALKAHSARRRASNRQDSLALLQSAGHTPTVKNGGAHLILVHPKTGVVVDFWPGTGLWIDRKVQKRMRGVKPLLDYLASKPAPTHHTPLDKPTCEQWTEGDPQPF